ncbi:MAG TPA: TauD/TfdA family dioxygenase [Acidimicrobiales bacterium]|nr:TauD/TfdA family dioxygenase [Acidimicrobiales bacterium]
MTIADREANAITVTPINPTLGAEVHGVDLADLDDATWARIEQAWADHAVLFFRDQDLPPEAHEALGRRIGELHVHPAAPTVEGHPNVMTIHADENSKVVAGNGWHTDVSCDERPPAATILHLPVIPAVGGDTLFISTEAAYDALSPAMQDFLDDKVALHESAHVYKGRYGSKESASRDGQFPSADHPVIRTHPVTGRKAIYVNRSFTTRIKGLSLNESRAILDLLFDHIEHRPEFQVRFTWTPGAVAMWDNRCTQHYAAWDYFPNVRSGRRVSVVGERPFR